MQIAIINQSALVTEDEAKTMTNAIAAQIRLDVATLWDRAPADVVFYTDPGAVPVQMHGIAIVDTIKDQPQGVLGFHTEDKGGKQWGVVAAKPELDHGAKVLTGDWSVSSVLSHEVLEMYIDPNCNLWANNDGGSVYSFEVCDPVEAPTYVVNDVSVSNFVTPAWFDPLAASPPAGADPLASRPAVQFDKLRLLTAPFTILKGGYAVYGSVGQTHQVFGEDFPDWRKEMKRGQLARTQHRLGQMKALAD